MIRICSNPHRNTVPLFVAVILFTAFGCGRSGDAKQVALLVPESTIKIHPVGVGEMQFVLSPDVKTVAHHQWQPMDGYTISTLIVEKVGTNSLKRVPSGKNGEPPLRFSPDGSMVISGGRTYLNMVSSSVLFFTDVSRGELVYDVRFSVSPKVLEAEGLFVATVPIYEADEPFVASQAIYDYAFSHDGKMIAASLRGKGHAWISLWEVGTQKPLQVLRTKDQLDIVVSALAFSADGKSLVAAGYNMTSRQYLLQVWDLERRNVGPKQLLSGHRKEEQLKHTKPTIVLSSDGSTAAWLADGVKIFVVKVGEKERLVHEWTSEDVRVDEIQALSPDGKVMLTRRQSVPEEFEVWDTSSAAKCGTIKTNNSSNYRAYGTFIDAGKKIAILDPSEKSIQVYRIPDVAAGK